MTPTDAHRLLLIDADESFIKPIQAYFEAEGFAVNLAQSQYTNTAAAESNNGIRLNTSTDV